LAAHVESPLRGDRGATHVFGAQKGISDDRRPGVIRCTTRFADLADRETAAVAGAGAVDGLGYALVLTGERAFDRQSGEDKVVAGVAKMAMAARYPCIVLAGRVLMSRQKCRR
jgi:glycerate kinase